MKAGPYFQFFERDFVHSCRTSSMPPDEVGALIMAMCQQWENMGALNSDPTRFAAYTGWDIRIAKRLLARLITIGKIKATGRGIENMRMSQEIEKYITYVRTAEAREARRRAEAKNHVADEKRRTSPENVPNFSEKSGTCFSDLSRKGNKINQSSCRAAPPPESESKSDTKNLGSPPPSGLGYSQAAKPRSSRSRTEQAEMPTSAMSARKAKARTAIEHFNHFARQHGWSVVSEFSDKRLADMAKRLDEIGGLDRFVLALNQIPYDDFLMGRIPGRDGRKPFRLCLETLLSTGSGLGDVLARLIDKASETPELIGPNGERWGFWRPDIEKLKTLSAAFWRKRLDDVKPNETWPWWHLGPPPGHAECFVHPDVITELGLVDKYRDTAAKVPVSPTAKPRSPHDQLG